MGRPSGKNMGTCLLYASQVTKPSYGGPATYYDALSPWPCPVSLCLSAFVELLLLLLLKCAKFERVKLQCFFDRCLLDRCRIP